MILYFFFFFNDPATTEIYTLSLHDALPISWAEHPAGQSSVGRRQRQRARRLDHPDRQGLDRPPRQPGPRSEEHTSELQSQSNLVCRLLLEKKKKYMNSNTRSEHNTTTARTF